MSLNILRIAMLPLLLGFSSPIHGSAVMRNSEDEASKFPMKPSAVASWIAQLSPQDLELVEAIINYQKGIAMRQTQRGEEDQKAAFQLIEKAATVGYAPAEFDLGVMYRRGIGTRPDITASLPWFILASNHNHTEASNTLGVIFELGEGAIQPDIEKAILYYTKAMNQGHLQALTNLERLLAMAKN